MAYGDVFNVTTPASGDAAGQGDDVIREFKRAVQQRLLSVFEDLDADPLKIKVNYFVDDTPFQDNSIDGVKIKVGSIPADRLSGIPGATLPADSVDTTSIQAKAVSNDKLGDDSVDSRVLAPAAVTNTELADNSVGLSKMQAASINKSKLTGAMQNAITECIYVQIMLPAATTVAAGGVFKAGENLANTLDTNNQSGYLTPCIIQPVYTAAEVTGATFWADGIQMKASIAMVGGQETIVYRLINVTANPITISNQLIMVAIFQQLATGWGGAL